MHRFLLLSLPLLALHAEGWQPPFPQPMLDDQAFAVAIISDVPRALALAESVVRLIDEDAVPGSLTQHLAEALHLDPADLEQPGPALVGVGPGGAAPAVALVLPMANAEAIAAAMTADGQNAIAHEGMVIIALVGPALDLGKRLAAQHPGIVANPPLTEIRITVAPPRILQAYQFMLPTLPTLAKSQMKDPDLAPFASMVGLTIATMLDAAADLDLIQYDIAMDGTTLTADAVVAAKVDSGLAHALVSPTQPLSDDIAKRLGIEPGFLIAQGSVATSAWWTWGMDLLEKQRQTPDGKAVLTDEIMDLGRRWQAQIVGPFAMRMRNLDSRVVNEGISQIVDAEQYRALIRETFLLFENSPMGAFFNKKLGHTFAYTEHAREINGHPVDSLALVPLDDQTDVAIDPEAVLIMEMATEELHPTEYVFLDHYAMWSDHPQALDRLTEKPTASLPLSAAQTFGAGRDCYVDWYLIPQLQEQFRQQVRMMEGMNNGFDMGPMFKPVLELPRGEAICITSTCTHGRWGMELRFPLQPVRDLKIAFGEGQKNLRFEPGFPGDAPVPAPLPPGMENNDDPFAPVEEAEPAVPGMTP